MKNKLFILLIILLSTMIITLVGYNTLVTKENNEKYQKIKQEQAAEFVKLQQITNTKIYCLGDSVTTGETSYPTMLSTLTGFSIEELGSPKEQSIDLSIRLGKVKIYTKDIIIPETVTAVDLTIYDEDSDVLDVLKNEGTSFSNVTIAGIPGKLKYDAEKKVHSFIRTKAGQTKNITALTPITAKLPTFDEDKVAIIFTGTYDPDIVNGIFRTITYQRQMISSINTEKYIVVSITADEMFDDVKDMNNVLKEEHKEHFLDFRNYLLTEGVNDPKIATSDKDIRNLNQGIIPNSLLEEDGVQGNSYYNELLAKQLLNKMIELQYIDENILK